MDLDRKKFSKKHEPGAAVSTEIEAAVRQQAKDASLPCAVAFDIALKLGATPAEIGRTVDLMEYRLVKCQMGLFGYKDKGKIASPLADPPDDALASAVKTAANDDRLACRDAWEIAARFGIPKLQMGRACETLGVKVKPCQLGAF